MPFVHHTLESMVALIAGKLSDDELVQLALLLDEDAQDGFWHLVTIEAGKRIPELVTPPP